MRSFTVDARPPIYLSLDEEQWNEKIAGSRERTSPCVLCARQCRAMRYEDTRPGKSVLPATGFCQTKYKAVVSSFGPHFGEEPPLVGSKGSGTIFFAGCNLGCTFCQNYTLAHLGEGQETTDEHLARMMLHIQKMGCHNINLVSPTHVVPNILNALRTAARQGLRLPLVYNTGGYDHPETIRLLDGVIDIYMPDMKYGDSEAAEEFSGAPDYPEINFAAVKEMHRQVGDLVTDKKGGTAVRGLLVRHLVLPEGKAGTEKVMTFIAESISRDTYVNIMAQYRPCYQVVGHPALGRMITKGEFRAALEIARKAGLRRI